MRKTLAVRLPGTPGALTWPRSLSAQTRLQRHLHAPHQRRRTSIVRALMTSWMPESRKWAQRLSSCCANAFLHIETATGEARPWLARCGSRLCPFCGKARRSRVADQVHQLVKPMKAPRHITLTYRSRDESLRVQLQSMRAALSKLRRTPAWRSRVTGGVYAIEITRNPNTELWHPHLHLIVDGAYFPQPLLAQLWSECMEGGEHVWIRKVDSTKAAAWEISKYIGKPPPSEAWPDRATLDYAFAVHGTRMLQGFGNCHGKTTPEPDEPPAEQEPGEYISVPAIAYQAAQGVPIGMDLAAILWSSWPFLRTYLEAVCPSAIHAEVLQSNDALRCPRPVTLGPGRYAPITDPVDVEALRTALHLTALLWLGMVAAGELVDTRPPVSVEA